MFAGNIYSPIDFGGGVLAPEQTGQEQTANNDYVARLSASGAYVFAERTETDGVGGLATNGHWVILSATYETQFRYPRLLFYAMDGTAARDVPAFAGIDDDENAHGIGEDITLASDGHFWWQDSTLWPSVIGWYPTCSRTEPTWAIPVEELDADDEIRFPSRIPMSAAESVKSSTRRRWLHRVLIGAGLAFFAWMVSRYPLSDIFAACRSLGVWVLLCPVLCLCWFAASSAALHQLLGGKMPWRALFWIRLVGEGYNSLAPRPDSVASRSSCGTSLGMWTRVARSSR